MLKWYSTTATELDDFYSDASTIRDVSAVEPWAGISVGEATCVYGRASNVRHCSQNVFDVSMNCGIYDRVVEMDVDTQTTGDSGGG